MAHVAACSERGVGDGANQDATCVMAAKTRIGEVAMAVVCDGVGGLEAGELASATVVKRFESWFAQELPAKVSYAALDADPRLNTIENDWRAMLARLNADIRAYGKSTGCLLGTTFSGIFVACGRYVAGHVGDCRILRVGSKDVEQISEDQTLLALKLRTGEITSARDACPGDANTILQAVGSQKTVRPRYYRGTVTPDDLLAVVCDGAWRKLENDGIARILRKADPCNEEQLANACRAVAKRAIERGETDNITVSCIRGDLEGACGGDA